MHTAKTIEQRLEELVAAYGDVPRPARRLQDYEARQHSDFWVQRLLGDGIVCHYVAGYQLDHRWWTFCFDRGRPSDGGHHEVWIVERYDSDGGSWRRTFHYDLRGGQWRPGSPGYRPTAGRRETVAGTFGAD